jgi:CDP-diglyceride synthetase
MSSPANEPDPVSCTIFLVAAFSTAGFAQAAWLRSPLSRRFAAPIDGGRTLRGKVMFGANKTWKGFVVMVPAVGFAFWMLSSGLAWLRPSELAHLWPFSPGGYFLVGCWTGLGFMLGELPNSFVKRQLEIAPGKPPANSLGRVVSFVVDRCDSLLGGLLALAMLVKVPWMVWIAILVIGGLVHWLFNVLLVALKVKTRAA